MQFAGLNDMSALTMGYIQVLCFLGLMPIIVAGLGTISVAEGRIRGRHVRN
jgi:hypothetical protein